MGFSEKTKLEAKRRSAFRCCLCHHIFVEIHHILPSAEGGPDTLDNAAPLCASCHDLFGGNPEKRKQIRELRDDWWARMAERSSAITTAEELGDVVVIDIDPEYSGKLRRNAVRMYHCIVPDDTFESMAHALWGLVTNAQKMRPGWPRRLYLDIDGHRNKAGGFDHDTWELQRHFVLGNLLPFMKSAHMPLVDVENPRAQRNRLPDELRIYGPQDVSRALAETAKTRSEHDMDRVSASSSIGTAARKPLVPSHQTNSGCRHGGLCSWPMDARGKAREMTDATSISNQPLVPTIPDVVQSVCRPACLLSGLAADWHVGR